MSELPDALVRFFKEMWEFHVDGCSIDGFDLQAAIEKSGLGAWRDATEADVTDASDFEVGDSILVLTEAGRAAIEAARE